jgi:hypothetical protein
MHKVAFVILIIAGLNAALEAFGKGLGNLLPGQAFYLYIIFGIAALYEVATHKQNCKNCTMERQG